MTIRSRLARLESGQGQVTHEETLDAEGRLDHPPTGYTPGQRARDEATVRRWLAAALQCGLIDDAV